MIKLILLSIFIVISFILTAITHDKFESDPDASKNSLNILLAMMICSFIVVILYVAYKVYINFSPTSIALRSF